MNILKCLGVFAILCGVAATAHALTRVDTRGLRAAQHGAPVGPDTVRVSFQDVTAFAVISTGEWRNKVGELHRMWISARPRDVDNEFQSSGEIGFLAMQPAPGRARTVAYAEIDDGDILRIGGRALPDSVGDIWVHAERGAVVTLRIDSDELDCTRTRICGRFDTGTLRLSFTLPDLPRPLPEDCGPGSTLTLILDGATGVVFAPGGPTPPALFEERDGDVHLRPVAGRVCMTAPEAG